MPLSFILDTDIGTDVDDALALAFGLRHPDLDLRAVTTVSGDTFRRARIAKKLLRLGGRDDIEVAAGERGEQSRPERNAEAGHEDEMLGEVREALYLSERDAVSLLLEESLVQPITIATIGMQSNIASALARDPSFANRVELLAVMGGAFPPVRILGRERPPVEHNLNVDQQAALQSLNAGLETLYVPLDVTVHAWLMASHVDMLRKADPLCRELARQIDVWTPRLAQSGIPPAYACLLHDPLAVACMVDRRFVTSERLPVTVALHEGSVRTFVDPGGGQECEVITSVDSKSFADFWLETVLV